MPATVNDLSPLDRARNGDERAFAELIAPIRNRLWGVCLRTTGNFADAEDALQDCLIAAWTHLGTFRGDAGVATWMYRIAANAALAIVRRRREVAELDEQADIFDTRPAFDDRLADRDLVARALAGVPEVYRAALALREYGELTYEEIAAHQGVPVQTVRSRINRGRKALRLALEREQGEPGAPNGPDALAGSGGPGEED